MRGSISELIMGHAVDFPAPCSPLAAKIRKGSRRSGALRKALIETQPWQSTLKKGLSFLEAARHPRVRAAVARRACGKTSPAVYQLPASPQHRSPPPATRNRKGRG